MSLDNSKTAVATAGADRIVLLDALRGFALLGILIANLPVFAGWVFMSDAEMAALAGKGVAEIYEQLIKFFVDGKFYTIFSLLFGIGFTLQLDRLEKRGAAGITVFRRRMLVLLAIGLIHMCLIWQGDILSLYAALGLLLPLFWRWKDRTLLGLAIVLLLLPLALIPLCAKLGIDLGLPFEAAGIAVIKAIDGGDNGSAIAYMQRTDWRGFLSWQLSGSPFRIEHLLHTWRIPKVLGVMLLGMLLGRRLIAGTLLTDTRLLKRAVVWGLAIGIPCNLVFALNPKVYQAHWSSIVGTVPLALAYAAAFVLAWPRFHRVLGVFAPVGRMALTSYLTHSVIGVLLLGAFLGVAGRIGPVAISALALLIYTAQILFSRWWLAHHAQGPLERLWRWGTYGSVKTR